MLAKKKQQPAVAEPEAPEIVFHSYKIASRDYVAEATLADGTRIIVHARFQADAERIAREKAARLGE